MDAALLEETLLSASTTNDTILFIDDLSVGTHPSTWLPEGTPSRSENGLEFFGEDERMIFLKQDARYFIREMLDDQEYIKKTYKLDVTSFEDVFPPLLLVDIANVFSTINYRQSF